MVFLRWIFGLPLAGLVTIALFAMMAGLVKIEREPNEPKEIPNLEIFPKIVEKPIIDDRHPPKHTFREQPPVEIQPSEKRGRPDPVPYTRPNPSGGTDQKISVQPVIAPLIRYNPPYPDNCRNRGATGIVLVQFDVSPEGDVINARVIDAPDRCFNRIISTVSKWKYPPAFENGRPVTRYGIVERFDFQLTD